MAGKVVSFRRDLQKALADAIDLRPGMTGEQLLARHDTIQLIYMEDEPLKDAGVESYDFFDRIIVSSWCLHNIARRAGVSESSIRFFNERRLDYKAWDAYRESLPPHMR